VRPTEPRDPERETESPGAADPGAADIGTADPGSEEGAPLGFHQATRWAQLCRGLGQRPTDPVVLALSGGADSVFLLHVLARAEPRPRILAVHVDHRLRGEESRSDAAFCARLCARLGVPFARREVELEADAPNLEARAREARYQALAQEAREAGIPTLLTGHHEDDALETLLLRWMRGSALPGLAGLKARNVLAGHHPGGEDLAVTVVRPLLSMRREEVRRLLRDAGLDWREDSSNQSDRFTRNRVRNGLLPVIEQTCGEEGVDNLRAFASAVESLEEELAGRTAHLCWDTLSPESSRAAAAADTVHSAGPAQPLGGSLHRRTLANLAAPLQRRALWRLLSEGTGLPPSRALLAILEDDLAQERETRRTLPGGWSLELQSDTLLLTPPVLTPPVLTPPEPSSSQPPQRHAADGDLGKRGPGVPHASDSASPSHGHRGSGPHARPARVGGERRPATDGPGASRSRESRTQPAPEGGPPRGGLRLGLPGRVQLPDGRTLQAELFAPAPGTAPPREDDLVELDAAGLPQQLLVRWARPGDRFHGLGAPGSRPLRRFLADAGVPSETRDRVPLVFDGDELLWVAGIRPCESRRIRPETGVRLRLRLLAATPATP